MEVNAVFSPFEDAGLRGVRFCLASSVEILTTSATPLSISNLSRPNSFLGLPLESGKCDSCGTAEHGECEGHFGYIELPTAIYHPYHVCEVKRILSLVCLNCLQIRTRKAKGKKTVGSGKLSAPPCKYCLEYPPISINEVRNTDGTVCLELKVSSRARLPDGFWSFLQMYGYNYGGDSHTRSLLPSEALKILERLPADTRRKLAQRGCFPQQGFIMERIPVPPNCLCIPDIQGAIHNMSSDRTISLLKKVIAKVCSIKNSRSGATNFEANEIESNDLQSAFAQYLHIRGSAKGPSVINGKIRVHNAPKESSKNPWLEKMRTLFISKSSGFASRAVITGDAYQGIHEIGLPREIAQKITVEEKVTSFNRDRLQKFVDSGMCITYRDGSSKYAMRENVKWVKALKIGDIINRRIVDGDAVFINRPPSTHKHSLQALSAYIHDDQTVKINPLICAPLGADFDGDCISLFYPQSLAAKAEALELFGVEQQLHSSHSGSLNLQLVHDSFLSLKLLFKTHFLDKVTAQQLAMWASPVLPEPAVIKAGKSFTPLWSVVQILQTALPAKFDCVGERHKISGSDILEFRYNRDSIQSSFTEILTSILSTKGPKETIRVFNTLQPLLMESLFTEGFSIGLNDFDIPKPVLETVKKSIQGVVQLLQHMLASSDVSLELQVEKHLKDAKIPIVEYILKSSSLGVLIDSKSDQSISKVVQQLGFLGVQLFSRGKYYSKDLVGNIFSFSQRKYTRTRFDRLESFGLVQSSLFQGLNPLEEFSHSLSMREAMIRASRGLTEPGILFKNLMAILRDVSICYDGTVRNACNNAIIQFQYGGKHGVNPGLSLSAGEPVGVLAATAISNPAYKAVLESSQTNVSSWEMMKEILRCKFDSKNDLVDRRVILYLNECDCGKRYCKEKAALFVQKHLRKVTLKDIAREFVIEYQRELNALQIAAIEATLVGHIHLDMMWMNGSNRTMDEILQSCQGTINGFWKKKHPLRHLSKSIYLGASECCGLNQPYDGSCSRYPCLQFSFLDGSGSFDSDNIEKISQIMSETIYPILLDTVVEGDPRVQTVNITWIDDDGISWVTNPCRNRKGEVALEVVVESKAIKDIGDAWRIILDCCLPVLHLIDTTRSIPYGIRQIQELLGISCAYDVSVQRLSTSMKRVAKGVLKEHLLLVADSMTVAGNLIGFNTKGFKALFRSLKVQVPFTEATLYMPMKCFEKAAERCYKDSLSSIVASCSWGKHVAVGTGTNFQVMWSKREMDADQDVGSDLYNFLQLVKSTSCEREVSTACLGEAIGDLEEVNINLELNASPEHISDIDNLTFDDCLEIISDMEENTESQKSKVTKSGWEEVGASPVKSTGWGSMDVENKFNGDENGILAAGPDVCSGWDSGKNQKNRPSGWDSGEKKKDQPSGWDSGEKEKNQPSGWDSQEKQKNQPSGWDSQEKQKNQPSGWDSSERQPSQSGTSKTWDVENKFDGDENGILAAGKNQSNQQSGWDSRGWDSDKNLNNQPSGWDSSEKEKNQPSGWDSSEKEKNQPSGWDSREKQKNQPSRWDSGEKQLPQSGTSKAWDRGNSNSMEVSPDKSQGWGSTAIHNQKSDMDTSSSYKKSDFQGGWTSDKTHAERSTLDTPAEAEATGWDHAQTNQHTKSEATSTGWGCSGEPPAKLHDCGWNQSTDTPNAFSQKSIGDGWNFPEKDTMGSDKNDWTLSKDVSDEKGDDVTVPPEKKSWGYGSSGSGFGEVNEDLRQPPGYGSKFKRYSKGPSVARNGMFREGSSDSPHGDASGENSRNRSRTEGGHLTSTGKRRDEFTAEELTILNEVEPLMLSVRSIMSRYKDGDRFEPEDQSCIVDKFLLHHPDPDKAAKIGGIDFVTVDKHEKFQDSRCLHFISSDGTKEDFSYRKCLENLVKTKFPENAESFNRKFFARKNRPT